MGILGVLWERGSATVRQVHDVLQPDRGTGYTTVLKLMQIMAAKGLARRDESQRSHVYEAAVGRDAIQQALLDDLTDRAFGGSTSNLVMRALSRRAADPSELAQIRALLDELMKQGEDA